MSLIVTAPVFFIASSPVVRLLVDGFYYTSLIQSPIALIRAETLGIDEKRQISKRNASSNGAGYSPNDYPARNVRTSNTPPAVLPGFG